MAEVDVVPDEAAVTFLHLMKIPSEERTSPEALRLLASLFWEVAHSSRGEKEKLGDLCVVAGMAIACLTEVAREKETPY